MQFPESFSIEKLLVAQLRVSGSLSYRPKPAGTESLGLSLLTLRIDLRGTAHSVSRSSSNRTKDVRGGR